jgi:NADP-dependent 3-hydroxy acid dehydrogenase YdfG
MKKTAMITGATSGIGMACAEIFAKNGYRLIINGRRKERLQQLSENLQSKFGGEVRILPFDVREKNAVSDAFKSISEEWPIIDVLVNNAGLALGLSSVEHGQLDHWDTMIDTNIKGLLYCTKAAIPALLKSGTGHIVNIGSIAGKEIYAKGNVYCSTKHAVDALNRSLRLDLSIYPLKVTAVNPGAVETEFSLVRFEGDAEKAKNVYEGFENLMATDVADAVFWAVSRPAHVNINDIIIMPTAQPMAGVIHRNKP